MPGLPLQGGCGDSERSRALGGREGARAALKRGRRRRWSRSARGRAQWGPEPRRRPGVSAEGILPGALPAEQGRGGSPTRSRFSGTPRPLGKTNLPGELRSGVRRGELERVFSEGCGAPRGVVDGGCGGPKVVLAPGPRGATQPTRAAKLGAENPAGPSH